MNPTPTSTTSLNARSVKRFLEDKGEEISPIDRQVIMTQLEAVTDGVTGRFPESELGKVLGDDTLVAEFRLGVCRLPSDTTPPFTFTGQHQFAD